MMMGYGHGFGTFYLGFGLIYVIVIVYFFYLLTKITCSLRKIADRIEQVFPEKSEPVNKPNNE